MKRTRFTRRFASSLCAFALAVAGSACGDDRALPDDPDDPADPNPDDPADPDDPVDPTRSFTLRIENIAPWKLLKLSSVRTRTTRVEGNLGPGDAYEFRFTANEGHRLMFSTMWLDTNDWFIAPDPAGIPLFANGAALTGDITAQLQVWDAGSELDQEPSVGAHTGMRQVNRTDGDADTDNRVRPAPATLTTSTGTFTRPDLASMIRVTSAYGTDGYFTIRIENISTATTMTTSQGARPIQVSPVAWAIHREGTPFFDADMPLRANGFDSLAESGQVDYLMTALRWERGVATALSAGVFVVHRTDAPLFALDQPDFGIGLESLAEDGSPSTMQASLGSATGIVTSGMFDTPVNATAAGGARPGEAFEVTFQADPGDRLSFATGFVASNDWFFAPKPAGIELFSGTSPRWGDITSEIALYDLGTEADEELDVGGFTGPQQDGPDAGRDDSNNRVRIVPLPMYETPRAYHLRVTLSVAE